MIAGSGVASLTLKKKQMRSLLVWVFIFLLANLPDFDLIFGYPAGNPNLYHHRWMHSLGFAAAVGLVAVISFYFLKRKNFLRLSLTAFLLVVSHLLLDYFTKDVSAPYGLQLFWPINNNFYISSFTIFRDVSKASSSEAFIKSLFCWHNFWTIVTEIMIIGPFTAFIWFIRFGRRRRLSD